MPPSVFPFAVPVLLFLVFWALCSLPLAGLINAARASARGGSALRDSSSPNLGVHPRSSLAFSMLGFRV